MNSFIQRALQSHLCPCLKAPREGSPSRDRPGGWEVGWGCTDPALHPQLPVGCGAGAELVKPLGTQGWEDPGLQVGIGGDVPVSVGVDREHGELSSL